VFALSKLGKICFTFYLFILLIFIIYLSIHLPYIHSSIHLCTNLPIPLTFTFRYSPTYGCGEIGAKDAQKLVRLCLALDNLISHTAKASAQKRNSMRRAQARMRYRIRNLIDECHKKTALWFVRSFDVIIIPKFNGGNMGKRKHRKIGSKTVRKMMTWAHARFRERLVSKAMEFGKQVSIVSEAYTSKTCSRCGWMHQKLGGRKVFKCGGCSLKIDRDINGARGIFLRALLDGAIFL